MMQFYSVKSISKQQCRLCFESIFGKRHEIIYDELVPNIFYRNVCLMQLCLN